MSRPQKVALQRCFLLGSVPRGVEDAAPYKREMRFFDTLTKIAALRPARQFLFQLSPVISQLAPSAAITARRTAADTASGRPKPESTSPSAPCRMFSVERQSRIKEKYSANCNNKLSIQLVRGECFQQRGFARAVAAQKSINMPRFQRQRHIPQCFRAAVAFAQILCAQCFHVVSPFFLAACSSMAASSVPVRPRLDASATSGRINCS